MVLTLFTERYWSWNEKAESFVVCFFLLFCFGNDKLFLFHVTVFSLLFLCCLWFLSGALGAVGVMKSSVCCGLLLSCGEVTCHAYFAVLIGTTCVLVSRNWVTEMDMFLLFSCCIVFKIQSCNESVFSTSLCSSFFVFFYFSIKFKKFI